jgi:formamidopyrimidine-DNA glycosylase
VPELPEVEHICRYLRERIVGRRIRAIAHLAGSTRSGPLARIRPRGQAATLAQLHRSLVGATIAAVRRRAKLVLIELDDGHTLAVHLKMTGKLWVVAGHRAIGPHTRAVLVLRGQEPTCSQLHFEDQRRFGWLMVLRPAELERLLAPFGPDALEAGEVALLRAYVGQRRGAKAALLDQRVVAGVGNIYADEILFAARIHPSARLDTLAARALRRLARATREVMAAAVEQRAALDTPDQERVGSGRRGVAARLAPKVYQRTGEPCPRCRAPIARAVLAGRATHFCPRCQPAPKATRGRARASAGSARTTT